MGAAGLLEDFGTPMTQQWSIGPLISWTLPSSGTHARIHAAEAGADAALAEFDHTVLQALRETQTALDRYAQDLRRLQSLRIAQEQAALAAEQNRRLYQGGRTPYLSSRMPTAARPPAMPPWPPPKRRSHATRSICSGAGRRLQASTAAAGTPTAAK